MSEARGSMFGEPLSSRGPLTLPARPLRKARRGRLAWMLFAGAALALASIAVYPNLPRSFQATSLVIVQPTDRDGQPEIDASSRNALDENAIQTFRDMLMSRPVLQPLVEQYRNDPEFNPSLRPLPFWLANLKSELRAIMHIPPAPAFDGDGVVDANLRKHMVIQRDRKSYALQIGFTSEDPAKAADMANTLARTFVAGQIDRKQKEQTELAGRIADQVLQLAQRARDSETAVNAYRVSSGLIHRGERMAAERELEALSSQLARAEADAEVSEDRAQSLLEMQRAGTLDAAPEVLSSPVIQGVKQRMMGLNAANGPSGIGLTVLTDLKTALAGEAQRIMRAAQIEATRTRRHADELQADIKRLDGRLAYWQEAERQLRDLERTADVDDAALKQAMAQLRTQTGRIAMVRPDAVIIAAAVAPARPTFPSLPLYAVGTLMMIVLTCGVIVAAPARNRIAMGPAGARVTED